MSAQAGHPAPSYIVRIYRRDQAAQEITGIVEIPGQDDRVTFRSFAELKAILTGTSLERARTSRNQRADRA